MIVKKRDRYVILGKKGKVIESFKTFEKAEKRFREMKKRKKK